MILPMLDINPLQTLGDSIRTKKKESGSRFGVISFLSIGIFSQNLTTTLGIMTNASMSVPQYHVDYQTLDST